MGSRRSPASTVAWSAAAVRPASGPAEASAPIAGEALAGAADWSWAGLGLATSRWGSEDGWVRTGMADAGDGLASAGACVKADGGLASDGWLKADGELIPSDWLKADGEPVPDDWPKGDGGVDGDGSAAGGWGWKRGCRPVSGQSCWAGAAVAAEANDRPGRVPVAGADWARTS